jgi:hypothetical protein
MRHLVRRSLAVAAATAGLVAFGATAAHADDGEWLPTEKVNQGVFNAVAADGGRVVLPPSDDDCDPAPGEICRVDPEDPTGYSMTRQASPRAAHEGQLISRIPVAVGDTGRVVCDPNGDCRIDRTDPVPAGF